ncbi:hypothetical protein [Polynucleobacter sp. Fuers-14]|uniref:hypothetical protein n=1 Tax=Polynucleobacter sp. Fuers-14 TaxID=1758364 RepID=UPI001C0CF421|nr:hypothetical protein [Polynucleobacter sp. Fuers-14]MBU3640518.1 hypothetical protein [Polynucleobacter sp. Fuers-14]
MSIRLLEHSFSAGELTPELFGRVDLAKRQEGLALCRNFITLPHGPAVNRPGTEYIRAVKNSANPTRLISFSYSNTQTFAIELGAGYFRFHTNGATLLDPGTGLPYEVVNSYAAADLFDIHYIQSADVMTLVHPNYPPQELKRYGATNWILSTPVFTPPANPITGLTATATGTGGTPVTQSYVVTTVLATNLQESVASSAATCSNDLTVANHTNTITWTDPSTAGTNVRYYIYKLINGLYGYIGQSASGSFIDTYITPDVSKTPPIPDANAAFNSAGNYPAAVSYFQQRRLFAGTGNGPQNLWATRSGTESDMSYTLPVRDDNRVSLRIAAREASAIRHIVPSAQMLLFTASCEWLVAAPGNQVLTPSNVSVTPQSYIGANNVTPQVVNNLILYAAARGGHIREVSYSWQVSGYTSSDICLMAPHLFDYNTILDMAYSRGPVPILWAISSSGSLLGMTYVPEQQLAAWHHHDTAASGVFESCCVVTENNEDMLYVIVNRVINGSTVRYVERLHTRLYATPADAFYVDAGTTYNTGSPVTTISGLTWLEGQTVNILADGAVMNPRVVTGGAITLDQPATKVTIGLPITAQLQTLPAIISSDPAAGHGNQKNVNKVWLRVYRSSGIRVGPDFNNLVQYGQRTTESYGSPPNLINDVIEVVLSPSSGVNGQVCIQQTDPLPLDIAAITLEMEMGG